MSSASIGIPPTKTPDTLSSPNSPSTLMSIIAPWPGCAALTSAAIPSLSRATCLAKRKPLKLYELVFFVGARGDFKHRQSPFCVVLIFCYLRPCGLQSKIGGHSGVLPPQCSLAPFVLIHRGSRTVLLSYGFVTPVPLRILQAYSSAPIFLALSALRLLRCERKKRLS